uniref:hypothetical protein n=1 Tax=Amycolatopsis sp. CA-096443 TaxID=3239919 RepID=UPI003F492570
MVSDEIFRSSDLSAKRTQVLRAARDGGARVRDKDGTFLVVLPEGQVAVMRELAYWRVARLRLAALLRRDTMPGLAELGDLAWLRVFDRDDMLDFVADLGEVLIAAHADSSGEALTACVEAWRVTARQLEDPLRRDILLSQRPGREDLVVAAQQAAGRR